MLSKGGIRLQSKATATTNPPAFLRPSDHLQSLSSAPIPIFVSQVHNPTAHLLIMADGISGRLEMYLLTPVPESQNSSGYALFRLPVPQKQLHGYLKRLDPKAKIVPDLTTLQHKIVKIIKQHLQRENLGLGVVKLVEQRVHSANDANICPPVNVVYVVLRPTSKDDDRMRQHQIETIPSENVANAAATLSTTYVRIVEIMPNEGNVEDLQAEAEPQVG